MNSRFGLFCLVFLFFSCGIVFAGNLFDFQGRILSTSGDAVANADINILLYHVSTGGSPFYFEFFDAGTNADGFFSVSVGSTKELDLNYSQHYYLDFTANTEDFDFGANERIEFESNRGEIADSNLSSNVSLLDAVQSFLAQVQFLAGLTVFGRANLFDANVAHDLNVSNKANIYDLNVGHDINIGRDLNVTRDLNLGRDLNVVASVRVQKDVNATRFCFPDGNCFNGTSDVVPAGNVLVVHQNGTVNSYDATADTNLARGVALLAAQTAAVSGDDVVVGKGNYSITAPLGKNGVDWFFTDGTIVTQITNETAIWSDNETDMNFTVQGGTFVNSATGLLALGIDIGGAHSDVFFDIKSISAKEATVFADGTDANVTVRASKSIISSTYDAVWLNSTGKITVETPLLQGYDNAFEGNDSGGIVYITADTITSVVGETFNTLSDTEVHVTARVIQALSSTLQVFTGLTSASTVDAQKILGWLSSPGGTISNAIIDSTGVSAQPTIYLNSGGSCTLKNVSLITNSTQTNSIARYSGSATVVVHGTLTHNKPLGTGIVSSSSTVLIPTLVATDVNAVGGYWVGTNEGITNSTSYWLCTAADCSTKCQVTVSGGIITGCT